MHAKKIKNVEKIFLFCFAVAERLPVGRQGGEWKRTDRITTLYERKIKFRATTRSARIRCHLNFRFLVWCDNTKTIADRIKSRYLTGESTDELMRTTGKSMEKFIMDNVYYSNFLRESCLKYDCETINTTGKTPEEVANEILSVIRGKGEGH